jgi:hypothetical protein
MRSQRRPRSDRSPESLETRLRALPQPPVPSDLEARLLAVISVRTPNQWPLSVRASLGWRLAVWAGASVAVAAGCFLAVRFWPGPGDQNVARGTIPNAVSTDRAPQLTHRQAGESLWTTPWLRAQQELDGTDLPTFTWPIQEKSPLMVSTALRPDLLD